jgi:hypothetical protein
MEQGKKPGEAELRRAILEEALQGRFWVWQPGKGCTGIL